MSDEVTAHRPTWRVPYRWIVAVVFVCGMFMDLLDTTVINVALPAIGRQFAATTASIEWIVLGYLLSLAVWIPASGWIGDRLGTRRVFVFAVAMFTLASALCGQAHSLRELVAFRMAAVSVPLVFVGLDTSLWPIRAIMFGRGIAMAFAIVPMQAAVYANITPVDTGRASAIYSTQRQVAGALGVATLGTVLVSGIHAASVGGTDPGALARGALSGYHLAFLVGTVLVALAAVSGLLI